MCRDFSNYFVERESSVPPATYKDKEGPKFTEWLFKSTKTSKDDLWPNRSLHSYFQSFGGRNGDFNLA
jgi:hypothetical protein